MKEPELDMFKRLMFKYIQLCYLLQLHLPQEETDDLAEHMYRFDHSQLQDQIEKHFRRYVDLTRAKGIPYIPAPCMTDESADLTKEHSQVMKMIKNSSVVPAGPGIRYHLVSMEWFKLWQAHTSSGGPPPGPINSAAQLKKLCY